MLGVYGGIGGSSLLPLLSSALLSLSPLMLLRSFLLCLLLLLLLLLRVLLQLGVCRSCSEH